MICLPVIPFTCDTLPSPSDRSSFWHPSTHPRRRIIITIMVTIMVPIITIMVTIIAAMMVVILGSLQSPVPR